MEERGVCADEIHPATIFWRSEDTRVNKTGRGGDLPGDAASPIFSLIGIEQRGRGGKGIGSKSVVKGLGEQTAASLGSMCNRGHARRIGEKASALEEITNAFSKGARRGEQ